MHGMRTRQRGALPPRTHLHTLTRRKTALATPLRQPSRNSNDSVQLFVRALFESYRRHMIIVLCSACCRMVRGVVRSVVRACKLRTRRFWEPRTCILASLRPLRGVAGACVQHPVSCFQLTGRGPLAALPPFRNQDQKFSRKAELATCYMGS